MNLSNFRIKTTLASLAILAGTVIPASPTFAQQYVPINPVYAGNDIDGTAMYVCSGIWNYGFNNVVFPGKTRSGSNSCDISWGGNEYWVSLSQSVVIRSSAVFPSIDAPTFLWQPSSSLQGIPGNALPTGFQNSHSLYSCRASYNGYYKVGKVSPDNNICYFGFNSTEQSSTSYDVLVYPTTYVLYTNPNPITPVR